MTQTSEQKNLELRKAFEIFNRVSAELDSSYRDLERRVSSLQTELSRSQDARLTELAEKECLANRLSALIAALPGGVVILDSKSRVQDCNPLAAEIFGGSLLTKNWNDVLARESVVNGNLSEKEVQLRNGRILSIESSSIEFGSSQRGVMGKRGCQPRELFLSREQVVLVKDVTAIHKSQTDLSRQQRLASLGEMAANLAHQIRTPLSSVTLYLSQLNNSRMQWRDRKRVQAKIEESILHIESLVTSMLGFTQGPRKLSLERDRDTQQQANIRVKDLLDELLVVISPQLEKYGAELQLPSLDNTLVIDADLDEMLGVLANLLMNSMEVFSDAVGPQLEELKPADAPRGAKIDLWVGAINSEQMQFMFLDNGPGIPEKNLPHIFTPFFTTRSNGTGLGLSVVAKIIESRGGSIIAENRVNCSADGLGAEGESGARFVITMPIAQPGERPSSDRIPSDKTHHISTSSPLQCERDTPVKRRKANA